MSARKLYTSLALAVLAAALVVWCLRPSPVGAGIVPGAQGLVSPVASHQLTGTASCSGRACHGGLDPIPPFPDQMSQQNEYPRWLLHDRHATAYEVLFDDRSKRIAQLLGIGEAHESGRCLACHTNPLAARDQSPLAHEERLSGVGCEACHGAASGWLDQHTARGWGKNADVARQSGMTPIDAWSDWAKRCAGCHVGGAPGDDAPGIPARDMNHDLIAAGHPRLDFEFGAFLANLPPHWRKRDRDEAKIWAVGQARSAEAALRLLEYRADSSPALDKLGKPWPEFSEYACYACHHDLSEAWRQTPAHYTGRTPGSLPWGSWYLLPLAKPFERQPLGDSKAVIDHLQSVRQLMEQPTPSRDKVAAAAKAMAVELRKWADNLAAEPSDAAKVRARLGALADDGKSASDWDAATQYYLAIFALSQALPKPQAARFEGPLKGMYDVLEAPFHRGQYHSPQGFNPTATKDGYLAQLDKIRELLKGP